MYLDQLHEKGSGLSEEKEERQVTTHRRNTEARTAAKDGSQGKRTMTVGGFHPTIPPLKALRTLNTSATYQRIVPLWE